VNPDTLSDVKTEATESHPTSVESLVRSLRKLLEGDEREQRETFEYLKNALEANRPSDRRLSNE
jgi:hypothetical protein